MLGRSDPTNVDGQNLRVKLPARSYEGGEVLTNEVHGYGSYGARMKLPNAPESITGFFLYKAPDYESEIDVEIYNDSTRRIMFSTYAGGAQTHTETMPLPFDPTAGFHEYNFDYLYDLKLRAGNPCHANSGYQGELGILGAFGSQKDLRRKHTSLLPFGGRCALLGPLPGSRGTEIAKPGLTSCHRALVGNL